MRLVGDDVKAGIYTIEEALKIANKMGLDLVEISVKTDPPVCKIIDYSRFRYEQKKRQKKLKSTTVKIVVKEIRLGPNTSKHDLDFKIKHARTFLQEGNRVKVYIFFQGRTIIYKEHSKVILGEFIKTLEDCSKIEQKMFMRDRRLSVVLSPLNSKSTVD